MGNQRVYDKITYPTNFTSAATYAVLLKAVKDAGTLDVGTATKTAFPKARAASGGRYDPTYPDTHGVEALQHFGLIEFVDDKNFKLSSLGERWLELFDDDFDTKNGIDYNYVSTMIDALFAWIDKSYGRNINVGVLLFKLLLDKRLDYYLTDAEFFFISELSKIKTLDEYENLVKTLLDNRAKGVKIAEVKKSNVFLSGLSGSWNLLKKDGDKYLLTDLSKSILIEKFKQVDAIADSKTNISETTPVSGSLDFLAKVTGGENVIFYGVPGCGKSHYVEHIYLDDKKVPNDDFSRIRTTFYHDYTNVDFVGQVLPKVNPDKSVTYEFIPGPFTLALAHALEDPDMACALIIEELNRGKAASIFGDIFQLLDRDDNGVSKYKIVNVNIQDHLKKYLLKELGVNYDLKHIKIPSNLYIVATMNTSDQNVGTLDNAFKRRWYDYKLINVFKKKDHPWWDWFVPGLEKDDIRWYDLVRSINDFILQHRDVFMNEDKEIGTYFIDKKLLAKNKADIDDDLKRRFAYKFLEYLWNDITRLIRKEELFDKPITLDSVIDDYVSGKVVFRTGIIKKYSDPTE